MRLCLIKIMNLFRVFGWKGVTVMKYKYIGNVKLDFSVYRAEDNYSDGNIEDELLQAVREGNGDKMLHNDNRWPVLYHLSPERENLLSWIPLKGKSVLEIGSGCGGVTGALLAQADLVECVELSPRRAEIAAWRHKDEAAFTIHVGNLNDMDSSLEGRFDYVTLIGVLEYAASFTHTGNPYQDFIRHCSRFLKPGGSLIIAIENRLGLKYFSGAYEDHTGRIFDGLRDYPDVKGIRTFSRKELHNLLAEAGFEEQRWYYPYPDYKIAYDIFSDEYISNVKELRLPLYDVYDRNRVKFFEESDIVEALSDVSAYKDFSNSFLVFANLHEMKYTNLYPRRIHFASNRATKYRIRTEIYPDKVLKKACSQASCQHISRILENETKLVEQYGHQHVAKSWRIDDYTMATEYVEGYSFAELCDSAWNEWGREGLYEYLDFFCKYILRGGLDGKIDVNSVERGYNIDLNFDNIIVRDGDFVIIDYEWLSRGVTSEFVFWRSLRYSHVSKNVVFDDDLYARFGINHDMLKAFKQKEAEFLDEVYDMYMRRYIKSNRLVNVEA